MTRSTRVPAYRGPRSGPVQTIRVARTARGRPGRWAALVCGCVLLAAGGVDASPTVRFEQGQYFVEPGEAWDVRILLDADAATPAPDALANGLFSFGVKVTFNGLQAGAASITVPEELDHLGFDPGAAEVTASSFAAAKGNIDMLAFVPYRGTLLATVRLADLAPASSTYQLHLDFYRTLGPGEQVFLDGAGNVLDQAVSFGTTTIRVVPQMLPGDADRDGDVDRDDLLALEAGFGRPGAGWAGGDFNLDGQTDALDYVTLKENFGRQLPAPVPEPASCLMLSTLLAGLLVRKPARC